MTRQEFFNLTKGDLLIEFEPELDAVKVLETYPDGYILALDLSPTVDDDGNIIFNANGTRNLTFTDLKHFTIK